MSQRSKKILRVIGIIVVVLVAVLIVLIGVGYLTLVARPLKPPQSVSSLAELETFIEIPVKLQVEAHFTQETYDVVPV